MDAGENVAKVSRLRLHLRVIGGSGGRDVRCVGRVGRRAKPWLASVKAAPEVSKVASEERPLTALGNRPP